MRAQTEITEAEDLWSDTAEEPVPLLPPGTSSPREAKPQPNDDKESFPASAADFSSERMLQAPKQAPGSGWRRAVFRLSGGLAHPGPSAAELRQRALIARVKTPIRGCRKIAFISRKGGVGKTTTCLLTGHTFASYRGDRVVALDGNPDAGTLGHRLRRETSTTVAELLTDSDAIDRYADIRAYTSQASTRLEVVAGDDDPQITQAMGEEDLGQAIRLLERHYNLVCLDSGPGVLESATRGILDAADQVVVVSATSLDEARAASSTLDWLEENGFGELVEFGVAVLNAVRTPRSAIDIDRIERHFASRCRACIRIPWDPHLDAGAEVVLGELQPDTRQAYLELAASVATGFAESTTRRS
jgi:putative peptide zinc metalloprotease protein